MHQQRASALGRFELVGAHCMQRERARCMLVILYLSMDDGEIVAERIVDRVAVRMLFRISSGIMGFDPSLVGGIGAHA
ncbi:hypothetical protein AAC387_Pa03g0762 [Persea americana]